MSKELFVSSTPHETKVAIVEEDQLSEVYFERENEYTLAGSIYKGRVTRVLPGMQSAFVNIGLERDAFLYVSDFLLEEEDEAEALEKVVSRGGRAEPRHEAPVHPIEAQEILPPAEPVDAAESAVYEETAAAPAAKEETEREGARKWRGRRRRGRGRERSSDRAPEQTQETGVEGPAEEPVEAADAPVSDDQVVEAAIEPAQEPRRHSPPVEPVRESRRHAPPAYEPIVLPGESISKYQSHAAASPAQPQSHAPVATVAPAPARPMPRPSTEYSIDASSFSPGAMVLPGESIAKYRHEETRRPDVRPEPEPVIEQQASVGLTSVEAAPEEVSTDEALAPAIEPEEPGPLQSAGYSYHAPLQAVAPPSIMEEEEEDLEEAGPEAEAHAEEAVEDMAPPVEYHEQPAAPHEEAHAGYLPEPEQPRHLAPEDLTHEMRHRELQQQEHLASEVIAPYMDERFDEARATGEEEGPDSADEQHHDREPAERAARRGGWQSSGRGLMEEEEIEEEETEFPEFEEQLDLAEFEELEEEELAPAGDHMVALGGDLTEAVRDAHVNEHATGKYEAEGLEPAEEFEGAEEFGIEDEDVEFGEEAGEAEGAPAVAAGNGAPHRGERPGRGERRRGGKPGRRMRGRPRGNFPRHMPAINDLLKEGQEILVQIAKEPIAKKGARITSHIALPGRFLVYMPTVHHTGVSRKIASEEDRQRLKRIVTSERGEANGGFIVRTAAAGASEEDLRADIRFLINLWNEIRSRADNAKAPALIYHDLNLVERILRDQVTQGFSSIWVDTEQEYERVVRFVGRFQPSLLKRVKLYSKDTPLFEQFNISDEINKALKSKVWLKSGGYIVINQTEALVAIDVNTGKYVGKTARLEDTIVKTNIDAIREIVRQIRLRDLGGIIVIDFIDMDERKNRHKVMQALEEALKADRAPSKVLQFNDFGLVAITRKRVKQSLERTLGQPCPICTGTGMVKSVSTVCNEIYVEMRKMSRHFERDVLLRVNPEVAKALKGNGARWLQEMEDLTRRTILIKSDPLLHPEQFDIQ